MVGGTDGRKAARALLEAACAWCGLVTLEPDEVGLHLGSGEDALLEFACPGCGRLNFRGLGRPDARVLLAAGMPRARGGAPFELLEERSGPPIGWDDIIEFHLAIARQDKPSGDAPAGFSEAAPAEEREAA